MFTGTPDFVYKCNFFMKHLPLFTSAIWCRAGFVCICIKVNKTVNINLFSFFTYFGGVVPGRFLRHNADIPK